MKAVFIFLAKFVAAIVAAFVATVLAHIAIENMKAPPEPETIYIDYQGDFGDGSARHLERF